MRAPDACPGVLRPYRAQDGSLVRLRLPGGRVSSTSLRRVAELATARGSGVLQLTSRAGLQIRGLPDPLPNEFVDEIAATGLLPRPTHERVRNIIASPLTGLVGGNADLRPMTEALDAGLVAEPALADLPGRFLFVLDDGRGDVIELTFDLGYQATSPDTGLLMVGSPAHGIAVKATEAAPTLLRLARDFATARRSSGAWHVTELPDWLATIELTAVRPTRGLPSAPLGRLGSAASVSVPLARLSLDQARLVETLTDGAEVVITPWRGLVLPHAGDRLAALSRAGFVTDEMSAWAHLSACVGAPFCAKSKIDTTEVAAALIAFGTDLPRTHLSGCERRCGAPTGDHLDLVAATVAEALDAVGVEQS